MTLGIPAPRTGSSPVGRGSVLTAPAARWEPDVPQAPTRRTTAVERAGHRRSWVGRLLVSGLVVALVVTLVLVAHLWAAADAWRQRAEQVDAQRTGLSVTAASLQQQVAALQGQLDASDARVEELAAQKARLADLQAARDLAEDDRARS